MSTHNYALIRYTKDSQLHIHYNMICNTKIMDSTTTKDSQRKKEIV